jgi:hypothetical protein
MYIGMPNAYIGRYKNEAAENVTYSKLVEMLRTTGIDLAGHTHYLYTPQPILLDRGASGDECVAEAQMKGKEKEGKRNGK